MFGWMDFGWYYFTAGLVVAVGFLYDSSDDPHFDIGSAIGFSILFFFAWLPILVFLKTPQKKR